MTQRLVRSASTLLIAVATAIVVLAVSILPFLNPVWVSFEQDRADAAAWTGFTAAELHQVTDGILFDVTIGSGRFDQSVDGQPVLNARERQHMRDVKTVFLGFAALAVAAAVGLAVAARRTRTSAGARPFLRAIRNGAAGLAIGIVAAGVIVTVAFEAAFEVFHRLFFSGGSYTFDPRTERLVQLFPQQFWFETSLAVGVVALIVALGVVWRTTASLRRAAVVSASAQPHLEPAR